jgi:hypothetical protein
VREKDDTLGLSATLKKGKIADVPKVAGTKSANAPPRSVSLRDALRLVTTTHSVPGSYVPNAEADWSRQSMQWQW